jgi:hypothetical protein
VIRQPTPASKIYAWHRAAMAGDSPATHDGDPQCGWFKVRLVKGGPWVPVEIKLLRELDPLTGELTAPERMVCFVDGERRDPARIWTFLTPISRTEFGELARRREKVAAMAAVMAPLDLTANILRPTK